MEHIQDMLERYLGASLEKWEQLKSGNSRVLKLYCADGEIYIAKVYASSRNDERDRLGVEFGAFEFLWKCGVRAVPEPLCANREENIALYSFVPGATILPSEVQTGDFVIALEFLRELGALRQKEEARLLPEAAEACLSFRAYTNCIHRRLQVLEELGDETPLQCEARSFLQVEFAPLFKMVEKGYKQLLMEADLDQDEKLSQRHRILSPSDFGFHNTIKQADGTLNFVDFEYFGWDDPAKMAVDFLHHPAMSLTALQKEFFHRGIL